MKNFLPDWAHPWIDVITIALQITLIVLVALLLRSLLHRIINRLGEDRHLPLELMVGSRRLVSIVLFGAALLLAMDRVGVSGTVIWTAFTGFAAVAAVAFFAAWSVLSNIFCAVLIYTTRPFGLHDHVELLESGDKPGLGGEVMDITLIYTTLRETPVAGREPSYLRVPNSLFFQRAMRLRTNADVVGSVLD
ncbi:mechanosensitive ion channel family protein [Hydrogenophaga sp.]|uniref:mechanosensitive ion channel family protein n=1 Tax=Hydrogenophaga sp. TaxID=1904254 RepID=UPI0026275206|nr:mechanosensitive ion channel family protein [Hydrogenophaga sp.]MCW5654472.1 mechanosensitive ion channel family protein [Hydrogenophaga sp.]